MQPIRSAAVVGSGIMGSQIAAHLASCGIPVLLLDMAGEGADRSAIARKGKEALKKVKPSPVYSQEALSLIRVGNVEDDLAAAGACDWIIEAIVELPQPKIDLFAKLAPHLGAATILATNTSGIPLRTLSRGLPDSAQERFIGTHFFNPPRYLRLVEVIRGPKTSDATVQRIEHVLAQVLNKVPVPALDSPAFIANRIGVHAMVRTLALTTELGLTVEEVDALTGPLLGRPKTATYKLADLVGLDTLGHIIKNLSESFPEENFSLHPVLAGLLEKKCLGRKTGAGFYQKKKEGMFVLDFAKADYRPEAKARFEELKGALKQEDLGKKLSALFAAEGKYASAARRFLCESLVYAAKVAPSVAEELSHVDEAMELGFGWEAGPFKIIDALGPERFQKGCAEAGLEPPAWVTAPAEGDPRIYKLAAGQISLKRPAEGNAPPQRVLRPPRGFQLALHRQEHRPVVATEDATLWDIGDEVLLLEFHSKMNSAGPITLDMIRKSVAKAADGYAGLVIANQGVHFCAGANIAMILLDAANGEYDNIEAAIRMFQGASMDIKYSPVPVVVSPHGMALGGGCEFVMHSQRPVLSPETYMGLVEVGVGLLPAGAGTKELALRAMAPNQEGLPLHRLKRAFEAIATAKVSTSAKEAFELGYLDARAVIADNETTRIDQAKAEVLALSRAGYRPPAPAKAISVLGKESLATFEMGVYLMREAGYASEHDQVISMAIARILSGGDVTPGTVVDEQQLLDLEREEFLKLVGTKKTQERIEHMLKKGKPLRN